MIEKELWKPVTGFDDLYEVSNLGRMRRVFWDGHRYLNFATCNGFMSSRITDLKTLRWRSFYLHRIVAEHWVENPKGWNFVRHRDGDRTNNRSSNLEWMPSRVGWVIGKRKYKRRNKKIIQK